VWQLEVALTPAELDLSVTRWGRWRTVPLGQIASFSLIRSIR
jgi:hypothetical protein